MLEGSIHPEWALAFCKGNASSPANCILLGERVSVSPNKVCPAPPSESWTGAVHVSPDDFSELVGSADQEKKKLSLLLLFFELLAIMKAGDSYQDQTRGLTMSCPRKPGSFAQTPSFIHLACFELASVNLVMGGQVAGGEYS